MSNNFTVTYNPGNPNKNIPPHCVGIWQGTPPVPGNPGIGASSGVFTPPTVGSPDTTPGILAAIGLVHSKDAGSTINLQLTQQQVTNLGNYMASFIYIKPYGAIGFYTNGFVAVFNAAPYANEWANSTYFTGPKGWPAVTAVLLKNLPLPPPGSPNIIDDILAVVMGAASFGGAAVVGGVEGGGEGDYMDPSYSEIGACYSNNSGNVYICTSEAGAGPSDVIWSGMGYDPTGDNGAGYGVYYYWNQYSYGGTISWGNAGLGG